MATYTTNLNLKKPAQSDKIRIADINNNMDDIDAAFGAVGTETLAEQLGAIQDSIAIVATGNVHAAITAGQFVFVKNHETLDTGLYVATSNISQNGTLSSSNLTADTAGGLNALSDKIATEGVGTRNTTDWTSNTSKAYKMGKMVFVNVYVSGTPTNSKIIMTDLPVPTSTTAITTLSGGANPSIIAKSISNGNLIISSAGTGTLIGGFIAYECV